MDVEDRVDEVIARFLEEAEAGGNPDPQAYLERHPELRDELASFFAARMEFDRRAEPLLPTCRAGGDATTPPPRQVGDFVLLEEIARGGMGVVYRAYQKSLGRMVALKMLRTGTLADDAEVQRFRREAEQAAALDHPDIVAIYAVDAWRPSPDAPAVPYYAMRLLEGGSLADRVQARRGPLAGREAAALVTRIARAVQFAHDRGVLHRDLKPGNILLDAEGRPHVGDFGLARPLDGPSDLTASHAIVGTAGYMAPEQAAGRRDLGVAVDVYGLGAILYECLTGRPPFGGDSVLATLQAVREDDPVPVRALNPSVPRDLETICLKCLEKEPSRRYASATALAADLDRWLQGEPIQARPSGLLERAVKWARRRPVVAVLVLLLALVTTVGVAALAVQTTAARQAQRDAEHEADEARKARDAIRVERDKTAAALRRVEGLHLSGQAAGLLGTDPVLGLLLAREGAERAPGLLANNTLRAALDACKVERRLATGNYSAAAFSRDGRRVALSGGTCTPARVVEVGTGRELFALGGPAGQGESHVALSPDGRRVVHWLGGGAITLLPTDGTEPPTTFTDRVARILDVGTGRLVAQLRGHTGAIASAAFSPDGATVLTASADGTARLWDAKDGKLLHTLTGHVASLHSARFSPDGRRVVTLSRGWRETTRYPEPGPISGQVDPEEKPGGWAAWATLPPGPHRYAVHGGGGGHTTGNQEGTARVWDAATGAEVAHLGRDTAGLLGDALEAHLATDAAFTPDGKVVLAFTGTRLKARTYDATTGKRLDSWRHEGQTGATLALAPGGAEVVFATPTAAVCLLGNGTAHLRHVPEPTRAVHSPDGELLAVATAEHTVHLWHSDGRAEAVLRGHGGPVLALAWSPDGSRLVTTAADGQALLWRRALTEPTTWAWRVAEATDLAWSPDGSRLAVASKDGLVRLFDPIGKPLATLTPDRPAFLAKHPDVAAAVQFDRTGRRVLVTYSGPRHRVEGDPPAFHYTPARLYDAGTGKELARYDGGVCQVVSATLSPCERYVLLRETKAAQTALYKADGTPRGSEPGNAEDVAHRVHDTATGRLLARIPYDTSGTCDFVGGELVAGGHLGLAWYDPATGKELRRVAPPPYEGPSPPPLGAMLTGLAQGGAALPDGSGYLTWDAQLLDPKTLRPRFDVRPRQPEDRTRPSLDLPHLRRPGQFHPDGRRAVLFYHADWLQPPCVWDLAAGKLLKVLRGHSGPVGDAIFGRDGSRLLTSGGDGTLRVWETETFRETHTLPCPATPYAPVLSPDGRRAAALLVDGTCRVWEIDLLDLARRRSPRELSPEERERYEIER